LAVGAERAGFDAAAPQVGDPAFRASRIRASLSMQSVAGVLCNDQPTTFGAPDVLQLCAEEIKLQAARDMDFADRPPNQVR
jgi:hypothetical protein